MKVILAQEDFRLLQNELEKAAQLLNEELSGKAGAVQTFCNQPMGLVPSLA